MGRPPPRPTALFLLYANLLLKPPHTSRIGTKPPHFIRHCKCWEIPYLSLLKKVNRPGSFWILLTDKQTNGNENTTSLVEVIRDRERKRERKECIHKVQQRTGLCSYASCLTDICRDTSDDETLFAVAPWQGIPQLLLKSLNLAEIRSADAPCRKGCVLHFVGLLIALKFNEVGVEKHAVLMLMAVKEADRVRKRKGRVKEL